MNRTDNRDDGNHAWCGPKGLSKRKETALVTGTRPAANEGACRDHVTHRVSVPGPLISRCADSETERSLVKANIDPKLIDLTFSDNKTHMREAI